MNGEIAQICNIVLATKSALKKRSRIKYKPVYYEKKSTFIFFNNKKYKAKSIEEWFDYCIDRGLQNIKFLIPLPIKDSDSLNFTNISQASIVCFFDNKLVTYFTPKWEDYNNEWYIIYTEHEWKLPLKSKPKFYDNTENFKEVLNRIAILADKINFPNFGNIFRKAFNILNGESFENIRNTFYGQTLFKMPKINARLFYSAKISDVFGGMGSWNDSPPYYAHKKGLESEYDSLTEELLTQIRLALLSSVNEW